MPVRAAGQANFANVIDRLRRPTLGRVTLDLPRTVTATIRTAGFSEFQYKPISRRPHYLVLIDRISVRDHQAILFDDLVKTLTRSGLRMSAYFFSDDPRVCRSAATGRSIYLVDLLRRADDHRLILLGDGHRLVSEWGELTAGGAIFGRWHERVVLTPHQPDYWGHREFRLAKHFLLLPATPQSLAAAVDAFDPDRHLPLPSSVSQFNCYEPDLDRASVSDIRQYLRDDNLYTWLCACALYPQLQWDLTLRLGSKLDAKLVTEANMQKLVRLIWFRRGSIPVGLQQALAESLTSEDRQRLRAVILKVLNETGPIPGLRSDDIHRLEINVQTMDVMPEERRRILDDETVAKVVAGYKFPRLALAIPPALRRMLYPAGLPVLGFRTRAAP